MAYKSPKTKVTEFFTPVVKAAKAVVKMPGKVMDRVEGKMKMMDKAKMMRDEKMIKENFGSVKNYEETMKPKMKKKGMMTK